MFFYSAGNFLNLSEIANAISVCLLRVNDDTGLQSRFEEKKHDFCLILQEKNRHLLIYLAKFTVWYLICV